MDETTSTKAATAKKIRTTLHLIINRMAMKQIWSFGNKPFNYEPINNKPEY